MAKGTRGALGSKGENGGGAGLGGHGGYAGDLQIVCLDETPDLPSRLFKEGLVGKQGKPGEGGEGGKPGKDGIDEAVWREGMLSKQKHGLGEYEFIDMEWGLFGSGATIPKRLRTLDDFERYQGTLQTESQRTLHGTRGGISTLPREEATRQAPISTQAVAAHLLDLLKSESFLLGFKQQIVMSRLATIARSPDAPPHLSNLERLRKQLSTVQEKIQNTEAHLHQLKTQLLRETHAIAPKPARDLFFTFDKILSITPKKTSDYVPLAYLRKDK
ncbi:MAG: hypothetical protein NTW94_05390 [Legionellales bacterium]|nr:hypothetical protein [Legionellales bacterium]